MDQKPCSTPSSHRTAFCACQHNQHRSLLETTNQTPNSSCFAQMGSPPPPQPRGRISGCGSQPWTGRERGWAVGLPEPGLARRFSPAHGHPPGVQDAFILRQLPHKARIGARDAAFLLHVVVGFLQGPAEFLHRVGYDGGSRATDAHFAVDQALGVVPPAAAGAGGEGRAYAAAFSQVP